MILLYYFYYFYNKYMSECNGPCLKHCYNNINSDLFIYFICGFIIGILTNYLFIKYKLKNENKDKK